MTYDELIERAMVAVVNTERQHIGLDPISSGDQILPMDDPYVREQVVAVLSIIYEALKEPSEGMIVASDLPDYRAVELWHALLSASPLSDKGETAEPVDKSNSGDKLS